MRQTLEIKPDLGLFREVLAYIDAHPKEWDHDAYGYRRIDGTVCGCTAYHTLRLSGNYADADFVFADTGWLNLVIHGEFIEDLAAGELGIDEYYAGELFDGDNTRERLQELFEELKAKVRR
jgi:hypothetical protein